MDRRNSWISSAPGNYDSAVRHPVAVEGTPPPLIAHNRRIAVIYNPTAGQRKRRRYKSVMKVLGELGVSVTELRTGGRGDAERLATGVQPEEFDVVAVAGGDGTINEAVNGLRADAPPLAIVPLGTANVLAAELGLRTDPAHIAHTIARQQPTAIHAGVVNDRKFMMMAGIGIDTHVVRDVSRTLKRLTGKGAYVWQALIELIRFPSSAYGVTIDGVRHEVGSAIFANGHFYSGRFISVPEARLEERSLYACLLAGRGVWNLIRYGVALTGNRLTRLSDVSTIEFREALLDGPEGDPIHADGEIVGRLPAIVRSHPNPLNVLCPLRGAES